MNMSPLSSPVPFAVLQGKGDLESAPKQMPLEEAKSEKPAGSAHPPQTDKPRDGDFAAVLAAARPQAASANPIGKAPVAPLAQMTDEALATLVADANDLIATFQAESGTPDLAEMIASFVVSLQAFDAATGGEAMSVLAKKLGQLDASGLARLEAAALDPAALFAALASLAGIPVTNSAGALIQMPKALQSFWSQGDAVLVETRVSTPGQIREGLLPSRTAAPTLDPELAVNPLQPQPSGPADMRMDVRTAVMNALAATGAGPDAEVVPVLAAPSETRPIMSSAPEMARPVDVWQPPASGFARNLVQQIRTAKFVDGHTRISLAPRGLGEIEIDMRPDEAGKLRIILRAENPAVLHALRGDRDGLLLTLTESGADIREADLSFEDFSHRQRRETDLADAPSLRIPEDGLVEAPEVEMTPVRITAAGSLDMLT